VVEIDGEHRFELAKETLWGGLFDPLTLRTALPAIESLERIEQDTYELVASVEVRGFWGRFRGLARVSHVVEQQSYHLRLSGAGAEGTAMAQGTITLFEEEEGVVFRYRGDLTVHGALTRLGGRFIGGAIRILIRNFLQGLAQNLASTSTHEKPE